MNVKFRDKNIANGAKVYFIDVNSADCILIWNDGKYGIRRQNINSIVAVATVNSKKIAFMGNFTNVRGGISSAEVKIATAICDNWAKKWKGRYL